MILIIHHFLTLLFMSFLPSLRRIFWISVISGWALASPSENWIDEEGYVLPKVIAWIKPCMKDTGIKPASWHVKDVNAALQGFPPEGPLSQTGGVKRSDIRWFQDGERADMKGVLKDPSLALQVLNSLAQPFYLKEGRTPERTGDYIVILGSTAPVMSETIAHTNNFLRDTVKKGEMSPFVYLAVGQRELRQNEKAYMKEKYQAEVDDEVQAATIMAGRDLAPPKGGIFKVLNAPSDASRKRATTVTTLQDLLIDLRKKGVIGEGAAPITLTLVMTSPFGDYQWLIAERVLREEGVTGVTCQVLEMPSKEYLKLQESKHFSGGKKRRSKAQEPVVRDDEIIHWANVGLDTIARTFYELAKQYKDTQPNKSPER